MLNINDTTDTKLNALKMIYVQSISITMKNGVLKVMTDFEK